MSTLSEYWQNNVKKNLAKISAILGDIIITIITVMLFAAKSGLDVVASLMMIIMSVKPFIVMYVNLVFKGEAEATAQNLALTTQKAEIDRELAEYKIQLAASTGKVPEGVIANKEWNDANESLKPEGS